MARTLRITLALLLGLSLPVIALAQTSSNTSNSALLAELQALEQQIAALTAQATTTASSSTATAPSSTNSSMCPTLPRSLSVGASGSDVVSLQQYLEQQGFFAMQPTGYFGSVTASAVAAWQISKGVLVSGDANAGIVGPKTRAAIAAACGGTVTTTQKQCLVVLPPQAECSTGWQPVADQNGCTMYYQCTISLPTTTISSTSSASTAATTSCPVVSKPTCTNGTVTPFQTNSNGCVTAYECVL